MILGLIYFNTELGMEEKKRSNCMNNIKKYLWKGLIILPISFIVSFILMVLFESIQNGKIPDFVNEEQEYSIYSEIIILLFYTTIISTPIVFPLLNLRFKFVPKFNKIWLFSYNIAVGTILIFTFLNPFHLFIWFMG